MSKKSIVFIIIVSVICAWLFDVFIGRSLTAKISTWPIMNRLNILSPQAPIVITNRETVRVSDGTDMVEAASQIKSKIASVVLVSGNSASIVGTAVNLSSDGSFVTGSGTLGAKTGDYYVVLNDGRQAQVSQSFVDPATSLVFFKAALDSVPVASIGSSAGLAAAEKIVFVQSSLQNFSVQTQGSFVESPQSDASSQLFQSDYPRRSFTAGMPAQMQSGEAAVNTNAEVVGVWNGNGLISADVLKQAMSLYFGQQKIIRPAFGFSYSIVGQNEAKLTGTPQGAKVTGVDPVSPAHSAGLLAGDVITAVNGQAISESSGLEEVLQNFKPNDKISLAVARKAQAVTLSLIVGTLK